jgi:D-sedoheptulose 7-phosphate isomerase
MKRKRKPERGPLEREARAVLRDAGRSLLKLERHATRAVAEAAEAVIAALEAGGTVYFCGNGGSAADAQHLAAELAGRYFLDRPALAATALTTNSSALTAIGNDFGFDQVFARQLVGLGTPGDVLVAISTSGRSPNVLAAIDAAHALGMTVIGMTGAGGRRFAARCDLALVTPSEATPRIQEGHIAMGHALCELVERALFPARNAGARAARAKPLRGAGPSSRPAGGGGAGRERGRRGGQGRRGGVRP